MNKLGLPYLKKIPSIRIITVSFLYYQIKRVLPSGAAAHSGRLEVGDRLITCNGTSLRSLTQNHCLDIIKSASNCGNIRFEVIRPVYNGNSMEISVTLNNGVNRSIDPSQYSVKAQSYDRQGIDVIVTSESEDYLTVSEDEFSKSGRLANIPDEEANEVFVSNSVRLAFNKSGDTTIEEESSETDTDSVQQDSFQQNKPLETIELNTTSSIPWVPPPEGNNPAEPCDESVDLPIYHLKPVTNPGYISSDSERDPEIPALTIPNSDLDLVSPRSPVPASFVDQVSPRSTIPASNLDQVTSSPVVRRKADKLGTSNSPTSNTDSIFFSRPDYTKRQQVPHESELSVPYNYPPGYVDDEIPVSDTEATRYNPLYEDTCSNLSEFTDSDTQDIYIASPFHSKLAATDLDRISLGSNRTITHTDLDAISVGSNWNIEPSENSPDTEAVSVPPPLEFSDNLFNKQAGSSTADQNSFDREVESDTSESELDEAKLAFNSELTAPFDIVLQEQGISVDSQPRAKLANDLQEITEYDDGTAVISQFETIQPEKIEEPKNYIVTSFSPSIQTLETTMDNKSEAMLKDALDMEYEQMSDSNKFEARIKLANNNNNNNSPIDNGFDDPLFENQNVVAENIAKDIVKTENGNVGYYVESDDEPDQFPEADQPEDLPDLPDMPPPPLWNNGDASVTMNGMSVEDNNEQVEVAGQEIKMDSNWSLKSKPVTHDLDVNVESEEIVPVKIQRKIEIPVKFEQQNVSTDDDVIVPESIRRVFQLPEHFKEKAPSPRHSTNLTIDYDDDDFFKPTKFEGKQMVTNVQIDNDDSVEVEEETIAPEEAKKDHVKSLVNVISVVNALKARSKDKDPDEVDKMEKHDVKARKSGFASAVLSIGGQNIEKEILPPRQEQIESARDEISVTSVTKAKPEVNITSVIKPKLESDTSALATPNVPQQMDTHKADTKQVHTEPVETVIDTTPVMKTSITVEKTIPSVSASSPVPPINLSVLEDSNQGQLSPNSPQSGSHSPSSYKTTIGVTRPQVAPRSKANETIVSKTTVEVKSEPAVNKVPVKQEKPALSAMPLSKPLSQIKPLSFNPKSLSQSGSRSVQYKTTISALGMKPGGLTMPMAGTVKPDHPIKRMETLPFEVSVLKGIMGIGIKVQRSPDGYFKVTEILQNGPIGREGNIK